MLGSSFVLLFSIPTSDTENAAAESSLQEEYESRLFQAQILAQELQENPENRDLQTELADAWLNVHSVAASMGLTDETALAQAITLYQQVLAGGEDSQAQLKLATAALYAGDYPLAGEQFDALLLREPENVAALTAYGAYLFYAQSDYGAAETVWQKAFGLADDSQKELLQYYISIAQSAGSAAAADGEQTEE
jgi:tetratricopeptide (TPR) repeat protein